MSDSRKKVLAEAYAEVHSQIGMKPVKDQFDELVAVAEMEEQARREGKPGESLNHHVLMAGNPGTGKTTVANALAKAYYALGILDRPDVVRVDNAQELMAPYQGQTSGLVREKFKEAKGGVLFIDEVGQLSQAALQGNSYAREALQQLMTLAENNREDTVLMLAGYQQSIDDLMKIDPGMKSRFPNGIGFPDYKPDELVRIADRFAEKSNFTIHPKARVGLSQALKGQMAGGKTFEGNARGIRNEVERARRNYAKRMKAARVAGRKIPDSQRYVLMPEDFSGYERVDDRGEVVDLPRRGAKGPRRGARAS